MDGHADRCATSIFDRVIDQIGDRPAQRERPGQYRGPPFTGVGHRAAGVGSILADPFDRGIGEYPRLPPRIGGSSRQLLARAGFDHCRALLGDHDRRGVGVRRTDRRHHRGVGGSQRLEPAASPVCAGLKWGKADQVIKPPPQRLTIALSYSRCPRRTSNMPGMDGLQLLGEIKQRFPDVPVMMVTAYGDDARRRQATEYGADKCGSCPARRSRNKHGQRCALFGFAATDRSIFARATAICLPQSQYRRRHPGPYRRAQPRSAQCRGLRPNWSNRAGDQSAAGKARLIDSGERTQIDA